MQYPLISEYKEAILDAEDNFDKLANLRPVLDCNGEPVMSSGNFAVVFKMTDGNNDFAIKCFTKEQEGRREAYDFIAEELECVDSSYITTLKYFDKELFVDTNCDEEEFPVLMMDWIEGESMEMYIADNYQNSYLMAMLCYRFCKMAAWLRSQPFAHGDLKPDNIMIRPDGSLTLVDYDGMFVPKMKGLKSPTIGTTNFSHPLRTTDDFDETIDDFSLACIALSLKAISLKPSLYTEYCVADRLLFSAEDYRDLSKSKVLKEVQGLLADNEMAKLLSLFLMTISTKSLSMCSFLLFNVNKPYSSEVIRMWSLLSFAKQYGPKMQVGEFVNKESKTTYKANIFTKPDGTKTFVSFSSKIGELTPKEISTLKNELIVIELASGNFILSKKDIDECIKDPNQIGFLYTIITQNANKLLGSLEPKEKNELLTKLISNELRIMLSASLLDMQVDKIIVESLKKKIYNEYLQITEIKDYDEWFESNTPGMCNEDLTVEDAITLAEFENKNGKVEFYRGKIAAYPYDDSFWGVFYDANGKKQIIYVDQRFPSNYSVSMILKNKKDFGIVQESTYYSNELVYCLRVIKKKHSMLYSYIEERLSFYRDGINDAMLHQEKGKGYFFMLYNAVINEKLNLNVPYIGAEDLIFKDEIAINNITGEEYLFNPASLDNFALSVRHCVSHLRNEVSIRK